MKWVDSHCHLHKPWFKKLDDVIERSAQVGVELIVNCASDPKSFQEVVEKSSADPVYHTLGIQPTLANKFVNEDMVKFFEPFMDKKMLAIGEVGLDYYWVKDAKDQERQRELFTNIIKASNELNLPLVIHSRKAESDCLDLLEKHAQTPVLVHSFDGNLVETKRAVDLGYTISVPTNVTIRKNRRKVVKRAGLENIVLETDSPFCAPDKSIERNDPSTIPTAGKYIAKLLEIDVEEVAEVTTRNAKNFYSVQSK